MKTTITYFVVIISTIMLHNCKQKENYYSTPNKQIQKTEIHKIEQLADGTSLEKLFSNKSSFSNKTIVIKGKVVKINIGIMDKNWVHISDGTQYDGKKSLTVTTQEAPKVGDTVTFRGTIILNKNFGQGYIYDIILEDGNLIQ